MRFSPFFFFLLLTSFSYGQYATSRSGDTPAPSSLRTFPCGGVTIYEENFSGLAQGQLPQDWATFDADTFAINPNLSYLTKGWQAILDFKDSTNTAMAAPSWFANADTSDYRDNWLMTKKVQLGPNTCLSWYGYSQDIYYPERYEVRISTTTQDTAAFLDSAAVRLVSAEFYSLNYRSVNLAKYANKQVYIAFRQKSNDKFVLVLDNVRFGEVLKKDPAMFSIRTTPKADTSKLVYIRGSIINSGSDTLVVDSAKLQLNYRIDGGTIESMTINQKVTIVPNDTMNWVHDSIWKTPTVFGIKKIEAWFSGVVGQPVNNDTAKIDFEVVGIKQSIPLAAIKLYPNPTKEKLWVWMDETAAIEKPSIKIWDMLGRQTIPNISQDKTLQEIDIQSLQTGIYFVQVSDKSGRIWTGKFIKE